MCENKHLISLLFSENLFETETSLRVKRKQWLTPLHWHWFFYDLFNILHAILLFYPTKGNTRLK